MNNSCWQPIHETFLASKLTFIVGIPLWSSNKPVSLGITDSEEPVADAESVIATSLISLASRKI